MIEKLVLKLQARDTVDDREIEALRGVIDGTHDIATGAVFIREGVLLRQSVLLLEGIACRFKDLADGGRQISAVHIAGDFVDLHSFTLKKLDHSIMALTPCQIATASHSRLRVITEANPHLTRLLWFSTNLDAAMHREWELSLGRRNAFERTAHLFCELHHRLQIVDLADDAGYSLPLTQQELSECLGLTPVHINRVLRTLRESKLMTFRLGRVEVRNRKRLEEAAGFNADYLYLERRPR
jgi:CRP-like cAMP-binding protein